MAKVDVIMSVRDGERFLGEALDSLASQTFSDFRLVAVDDASSDRTLNILEGESRFETRILKNEVRNGLARSLNRLLGEPTEARYYARFDPDDVCEPKRLSEQVDFMDRAVEVGIAGAQAVLIDEEGKVIGKNDYPETDPEIRFEMCFRCPLLHPATILRRETLMRHHLLYSEFYHCEDYEYWCRILEVTQAHNLKSCLLQYRRHSEAVGVSKFDRQEADFHRVRREWIERQFRCPQLKFILSQAFECDTGKEVNFTFRECVQFCRHLNAWMALNNVQLHADCVRDRVRGLLSGLSKGLALRHRLALLMHWPFRYILFYDWSTKVLRRLGVKKR